MMRAAGKQHEQKVEGKGKGKKEKSRESSNQ